MTTWSLKKNYNFTEEFKEILRFYLLECPIEDVSRRADASVFNHWIPRELRHRMEEASGLSANSWKMVATREVEQTLRDMNCYYKVNPNREVAVHIRSRNLNTPKALIYLVRCALAHSSFSQRVSNGETFYVLENTNRNVLKGRAVLKEKTLISWINLIKKGP